MAQDQVTAYHRRATRSVIVTGLALSNAGFSAEQTLPAGTLQAWMVFDAAPGATAVRYNGVATELERLANPDAWFLFPNSVSPYPLLAALTIAIQTTNATNATIYALVENR